MVKMIRKNQPMIKIMEKVLLPMNQQLKKIKKKIKYTFIKLIIILNNLLAIPRKHR